MYNFWFHFISIQRHWSVTRIWIFPGACGRTTQNSNKFFTEASRHEKPYKKCKGVDSVHGIASERTLKFAIVHEILNKSRGLLPNLSTVDNLSEVTNFRSLNHLEKSVWRHWFSFLASSSELKRREERSVRLKSKLKIRQSICYPIKL